MSIEKRLEVVEQLVAEMGLVFGESLMFLIADNYKLPLEVKAKFDDAIENLKLLSEQIRQEDE